MNRRFCLLKYWTILFMPLWLIWGCSESNMPTPVDPKSAPASVSIKTPVRIAGFDSSVVLISDYGNNAILKMRLSDQKLIGKIDITGNPTGLACLSTELFVGNESTGSIEVYDIDTGRFLRRFGKAFTLPNSIISDDTSSIIFAVDTAAGLIRQFNIDGTPAGPDLGAGILSNPTAITIDETNQWIYVSDFGEPVSSFGDTPAIHIIPYGSSTPVISRIEGVDFDFDRPQGLTVHNNKLFVAESVAGEIIVFDIEDLSNLSKLPAFSNENLKMPLDVFIDSTTNDLFVTNAINSEIVVFPGGGS